MKSMRIPLLIALGVAIIGIVFGSFFDLSISRAIASANNGFALTISAIGPTIGFAAVAAMGGGFIRLALHGKYHIALKVIFYVLAAACLGVSIYYPAGEYFGVNGFYGAAPEWVGYLIVLVPEAAAGVGGQKGLKDPRVSTLASITRVDITEDLSYAKALVSVMGSDKEKRDTLVGLNNSAGFIRGVLGKALKIFKVPELKFVLDENLEHAMHIEEILAELKQKGEL